MRQKRTLLLAPALLAVTLAIVACTGDGDAPAPTTTPVPQATAVPPPDRPNSIRDYARIAAQYLTADPAASRGGNCLAALYTAWEMPYFSRSLSTSLSDGSCRNGNTDSDADDEVAAAFVSPQDAQSRLADLVVVIFDRADGGFRVAYESPPASVILPERNHLGNAIVDIGDVNGDDAGELVYMVRTCGANTCTETVFIVSGRTEGYLALTDAEGISLESAEVRFEDIDGDGAKELLMSGGEVGSVGAGPQRQRTETYAWDGETYTLRDTKDADPVYLYHAVLDGDRYFAEGSYDVAIAVYLAAAGNASLETWKEATGEVPNEREELQAYALYRAGLATLASDGRAETANEYFARAIAYAGTLHQQLAGVFRAAYAAKGELSVGCAAVRDALSANRDEYATFWDYGYANPEFDPDSVCPY